MRKTIKIVGYTLATLVILVIVAAVALPFVINPNDHKDEIVKLVHDATGRKLTIAGDIRLSVFPWLGVKVNEVSLGNAAGFGPSPFASIREADVSVRLIPLIIHRQLQVSTVNLQGLQVHLARNASGVFNWSDLTKGKGGGTGGKPGTSGSAAPLAALTLGGVQIDNATFTWDDAVSNAHYGLEHVNLTTGAFSIGESFPLKLAFDMTTNSPAVHGHVSLSANVSVDPGKDNYHVDGLNMDFDAAAQSPSLKLKGSLSTAITAHPNSGRYQIAAGHLTLTPSGPAVPLNAGQLQVKWQPIDANLVAQTADVRSLTVTGLGLLTNVNIHTANWLGSPRVDGHLQLSAASLEPLLAALGSNAVSEAGAFGKITASGAFSYDVKAAEARLDKFTLSGLGAEIHAKATANSVDTAPQVQASITMPEVPAEKVFAHLGKLVPETLQGRDVGKLAFASQMTIDLGKHTLSVPVLKLEALGASLTGHASGQGIPNSPVLDVSLTVPNVDAASLLPRLKGWLPANIDARAVGQVGLSSDFRFNLSNASVALNTLTVVAAGTELVAKGQGSQLFSKPAFDGSIRLHDVSPRRLLKIAAIPITTTDPHALSRLAVSAHVLASTDSLKLVNLDVHLDETHLRGRLGVRQFSKPAADFDLAVDQIDIDRYLPPAAQKQSPGHPQSGAMDTVTLPFGMLAGINVNGKLTIGKMRAFSIHSTHDELVLHVANRKLRAHPLKAELYGGTYSGDVNVDAATTVPTVSMNETVSHIGVGKLIKDLAGIQRLSGTGDFHVKLSGRGATMGAIRKTLSGNVSFSLKDGAIEGVNLWGAILTAHALLKGQTPPASNGPQRTEFTELSGTGEIDKGVLDNRDLLVKLPFLRVTGAGKLDLARQTINYKATAKVIGTPKFSGSEDLSDLKGLNIPLDIGGSFTKPTVKPDLQSVWKEHLQNKAKEKMKKAEDKLKGKLDNALKNIFGGGH